MGNGGRPLQAEKSGETPKDAEEGCSGKGKRQSEGSEEEPARMFEEEKEGHSGGEQVWPQCGKRAGRQEGSGASCTGPAGQGERSGLYVT